jgi:hypothetical protein
MTDDQDAARLREHVEQSISNMHSFPEGWPANVELALIDTVLSIRARYGVTADTGVRGAIKRYKAATDRTEWNDLKALAGVDPAWLSGVLANRQKTGGVPKSEAIVSAAGRLADVGAVHSSDIDRNSDVHRRAYCGTRGLGPVTWQYFLMLIGHDGVKADTLVTRFVTEAVGRKLDSDAVAQLVTKTAAELQIRASDLDHSIWRHMSNPRRS